MRRRVALTCKFATVEDDLTGWENLTLLGRLAGLAARTRTSELLLPAFRHGNPHPGRSKTFSEGMRPGPPRAAPRSGKSPPQPLQPS